MHAWEQIQETVDYIEEHLSDGPDIENLAKMASLSPFYYQRLFSRLIKKPVVEYIKLRRMARATDFLLQKDRRILDVALDLGYSSHEQFSRTFKNTFGLTPEEYRKKPVALNRMNKPQLLLNYTLVDENVPLVSDGIVLEISRKRLPAAEHFSGLETKAPVEFVAGLGVEPGVDPLDAIWRAFHDKKDDIPGLLPEGDEIGVSYPCAEAGFFCYFAGAQARHPHSLKDMKSYVLPEGEYIVCAFEAEDFEALVMDALYKAHRYLFEVWLPNHGLTAEPFAVERYASHEKHTKSMEIWILPVKQ